MRPCRHRQRKRKPTMNATFTPKLEETRELIAAGWRALYGVTPETVQLSIEMGYDAVSKLTQPFIHVEIKTELPLPE